MNWKSPVCCCFEALHSFWSQGNLWEFRFLVFPLAYCFSLHTGRCTGPTNLYATKNILVCFLYSETLGLAKIPNRNKSEGQFLSIFLVDHFIQSCWFTEAGTQWRDRSLVSILMLGIRQTSVGCWRRVLTGAVQSRAQPINKVQCDCSKECFQSPLRLLRVEAPNDLQTCMCLVVLVLLTVTGGCLASMSSIN